MTKNLVRALLAICSMLLPLSFADVADARKAGKGQQEYYDTQP